MTSAAGALFPVREGTGLHGCRSPVCDRQRADGAHRLARLPPQRLLLLNDCPRGAAPGGRQAERGRRGRERRGRRRPRWRGRTWRRATGLHRCGYDARRKSDRAGAGAPGERGRRAGDDRRGGHRRDVPAQHARRRRDRYPGLGTDTGGVRSRGRTTGFCAACRREGSVVAPARRSTGDTVRPAHQRRGDCGDACPSPIVHPASPSIALPI